MRSFDELAQKARDPKALTFERKNAVQELAKQGGVGAVDVLGALLDDREGSIRREAIAALGAIKSPEAAELLILALDDKDRSCVRAALDAIGNRHDAAAVPALERLVETADFSTRIEAERLLKLLGAAKDVEVPHPGEAPHGEPTVEMPKASRAESAPRTESAPKPRAERVVLVPPPSARPPAPPPLPPRVPHAAPTMMRAPQAPLPVAPPVPEHRGVHEHVPVPPPQLGLRPAPPPPPNVRRHSAFGGSRPGQLSREAFVGRAQRARAEENVGAKAAAVVFAVIVFFIFLMAVCARA